LSAAADVLAGFLAVPADRQGRAALTLALRPRDDDYPRVFAGAAAEAARLGYLPLWNTAPVIEPQEGQTQVRVAVATSAELAIDSVAARGFPGGYRHLVGRFMPETIWAAWQFLRPGDTSGLQFDGLVYLDGRFAWFPKPWLVLPSVDRQNRP
jgi:hypothetical protein